MALVVALGSSGVTDWMIRVSVESATPTGILFTAVAGTVVVILALAPR